MCLKIILDHMKWPKTIYTLFNKDIKASKFDYLKSHHIKDSENYLQVDNKQNNLLTFPYQIFLSSSLAQDILPSICVYS